MTQFHLHLVSDSTGETLNSVVNAVMVQFSEFEPKQHLWPMVRSRTQITRVLDAIEAEPGIVAFTIVDHVLREQLQEGCLRLNVPCVPVLDPLLQAMAEYLHAEAQERPGRQHAMNEAYFRRIDAMHFCMSHDDGQGADSLNEADVVLVGVSRTSKTPTCIYLANRGIKAANVPIVPDLGLPAALDTLDGPLVVGLTAAADRLVQIRRNRLLTLHEESETDYADFAAVKEELQLARRACARHGWPVIDVTRRSIEETAAAILNLYHRREAEADAGKDASTG